MAKFRKWVKEGLGGDEPAGYRACQYHTSKSKQPVDKRREMIELVRPLVKTRAQFGWPAEGLTHASLVEEKRRLRKPPRRRRAKKLGGKLRH
ncbi:hypothetical protein KKE45_00945 [Patescibacteria group bacterium]|nr:hypothetical protein [Patescibacteria group bacterium]